MDDHNRHLAGDYNDMFARWLPGEWRVYDLEAGDFPRPQDCDAWISTGSHYSVYNDVPWIEKFAQLIRDIDSSGRPFVGICFGHQMMAHALGGRVSKSPRGWGIGVHTFCVHRPEPWMQPPLASVSLLMSCQDQVEVLPPDSVVLASSDHCQVAIYRRGAMLGIQGHPEWQPPYAAALLNERTERIGEDRVASVLDTLDTIRHSAELSQWARNWIDTHAKIGS
ncbi:MAG: type 1 glutamine amidotransferase [Acidobacteriota bacterium]